MSGYESAEKWVLLGGFTLVVAVSAVATWKRKQDGYLKCPPGMVAAGDSCSCASHLHPSENGCLPLPEKIVLPPGHVVVGSASWDEPPNEARVAAVERFSIDRFEVTVFQYSACVRAGICAAISELENASEPSRAVSFVDREQAKTYCKWSGGSLPTSDQLVYAAAGNANRRYPWGDTGAVCRKAIWGREDGPCETGAQVPDVVGMTPAGSTPEGVADLAGNVAEWTLDETADKGVAKGGSFRDKTARSLRSLSSQLVDPTARLAHLGFRCVY